MSDHGCYLDDRYPNVDSFKTIIMNISTGIGFRRDIADVLINSDRLNPDFIEFAPENWMGIGGYWKKILNEATQKYPATCHGLSMSLGSPDELDINFLRDLKKFLNEYNVQIFSEHLSYTKSQNAHMYDLLPIPFKEDAVYHVAGRIRQAQEILERKIAIEIVSYYTPVAAEMSELDFINEIVKEADCQLLLDVNNVYVNSFNHKYDPYDFISGLPLDKVAYIHMAGHEQVEPDLIIDTHGQPIIDPVYELFAWTVSKMDPVPVLLERDYNFDELDALNAELSKLREITKNTWEVHHEASGTNN